MYECSAYVGEMSRQDKRTRHRQRRPPRGAFAWWHRFFL